MRDDGEQQMLRGNYFEQQMLRGNYFKLCLFKHLGFPPKDRSKIA